MAYSQGSAAIGLNAGQVCKDHHEMDRRDEVLCLADTFELPLFSRHTERPENLSVATVALKNLDLVAVGIRHKEETRQ
jgi:hypothetical protein